MKPGELRAVRCHLSQPIHGHSAAPRKAVQRPPHGRQGYHQHPFELGHRADAERNRPDLSADLAGRVSRGVHVYIGTASFQRPHDGGRDSGGTARPVSARAAESDGDRACSSDASEVDVGRVGSTGEPREPKSPGDRSGRSRFRDRRRERPGCTAHIALRLRNLLPSREVGHDACRDVELAADLPGAIGRRVHVDVGGAALDCVEHGAGDVAGAGERALAGAAERKDNRAR